MQSIVDNKKGKFRRYGNPIEWTNREVVDYFLDRLLLKDYYGKIFKDNKINGRKLFKNTFFKEYSVELGILNVYSFFYCVFNVQKIYNIFYSY